MPTAIRVLHTVGGKISRSGAGVDAAQLTSSSRARQQLDEVLKRGAALERQESISSAHYRRRVSSVYRDEADRLPTGDYCRITMTTAVARAARQAAHVAVLFSPWMVSSTLTTTFESRLRRTLAAVKWRRGLSADSSRFRHRVPGLGGDEFVVLLPELESHERAVTAAAEHPRGVSVPIASSTGLMPRSPVASGWPSIRRMARDTR
jgi:hypothetical protein